MFKGSQTLGPIVVLRPRCWLMGGIGCETQVKVSWLVRGGRRSGVLVYQVNDATFCTPAKGASRRTRSEVLLIPTTLSYYVSKGLPLNSNTSTLPMFPF
jgi:hypothetical protein